MLGTQATHIWPVVKNQTSFNGTSGIQITHVLLVAQDQSLIQSMSGIQAAAGQSVTLYNCLGSCTTICPIAKSALQAGSGHLGRGETLSMRIELERCCLRGVVGHAHIRDHLGSEVWILHAAGLDKAVRGDQQLGKSRCKVPAACKPCIRQNPVDSRGLAARAGKAVQRACQSQ